MIYSIVVAQARALKRLGWSVRRTARAPDLSRNTVRRYRKDEKPVGVRVRPKARADG